MLLFLSQPTHAPEIFFFRVSFLCFQCRDCAPMFALMTHSRRPRALRQKITRGTQILALNNWVHHINTSSCAQLVESARGPIKSIILGRSLVNSGQTPKGGGKALEQKTEYANQ